MQLYKEHREGIYQTCKSLVHDQPFSSVIISISLTSSFFATHQRKHALRCYQQALYVYRGKSWSLAEVRQHAILFDKCGAY